MKRYRLTVNGKTHEVEVLDNPTLAEVRVDVDGEIFTVAGEPLQAESAAVIAAPGRNGLGLAPPGRAVAQPQAKNDI